MNTLQWRILLVEDDEDDYVMTRDLLSEMEGVGNFALDWVTTYDSALEAMRDNRHDVYLVDYRLGERNGMDLLREAIQCGCRAPIILLTGQGDREVDIEAMKAGASDYLEKGETGPRLLERSIRYAVERYRLQEELKESRERFALFMRYLPGTAYIKNDEGKILFMNECAEKYFDWNPETILGKSDFDFWPADRAAEIREVDRTILATGKCHQSIEDIHTENKSFAFLTHRFPIFRKGLPTLIGGISIDITERRRAQNALVESERKYSTLVENSHTGIYINRNGKIAFANNRFAEIFGYTREELTGIDTGRLTYPEDRPYIDDAIKKCLEKNRGSLEYEARCLTKDGNILWIENIITPIQYEGEPAVLGNIFDITKRKKMEANLKRSEQDLRFLSSQLLKAQEEERKRIARELQDTIAQDLAAIKVFLNDTFKQADKGPSSSGVSLECINLMVGTSIKELRRIMTDLRPRMIDELGILAAINSHCREFQEIYNTIVLEKQVAIKENEIPSPLKIVIYRILQEALNNIAKHSMANLAQLAISKNDGKIEMVVRDNGLGFDIKNALSPGNTNRGLGIIGMKERAELSKGAFFIDSRKGSGTRVSVSWNC